MTQIVSTLSDAMRAAKNQQAQTSPWIWLFEAWTTDTTANRIAQYTENVTWGGNVYYAHPVSFDVIRTSEDASQTTITIPDQRGLFRSYFDGNEGLRGKVVIVRLVLSTDLANTVPALESRFRISTATLDYASKTMVWTVGPKDIYDRKVPRRHYNAHRCPWHFGGVRGREGPCGFNTAWLGSSQPPQSCDRTWDGPLGCKQKQGWADANGHRWKSAEHFGAMLGIADPRQ